MLTVILSIVIFLIFGVVFSIIILNSQSEKRKRLMRVVKGSSSRNASSQSSSNLQNNKKPNLAKKLNEAENEAKKEKKSDTIKEKIQQSGMEISVNQFWLASVVSCLVVAGLAKMMGVSPFLMIMSVIIGFFGVPRVVLNFKIGRRQKKFMEDFPDALDSMMRLLKAGMPVSEAIKMVAREFEGPMGEEMGRIFDQQKIGIPLPEAVLNAAKRMPLAEMQMFATAIAIQTQTGSSLSEVLQNLSAVIRSRFKLARKVKALSSEAKASAMIIGALPCVVAGGMYFINREYIEVLFTDPTGKFLLGCAIGWMFCGVLVMRQMINFKV